MWQSYCSVSEKRLREPQPLSNLVHMKEATKYFDFPVPVSNSSVPLLRLITKQAFQNIFFLSAPRSTLNIRGIHKMRRNLATPSLSPARFFACSFLPIHFSCSRLRRLGPMVLCLGEIESDRNWLRLARWRICIERDGGMGTRTNSSSIICISTKTFKHASP